MHNPFTIISKAEWNVLKLLADESYEDFSIATKANIGTVQGVNHRGSCQNPSNAFTVCKKLQSKGLVITNTENESYSDLVFLTRRGLELIRCGEKLASIIEETENKIMSIEPTKVLDD